MDETEIRKEIEQLRAKIDRVDQWASGVLVALNEALRPLLRDNPAAAAHLAKRWRNAAVRFEQVSSNQGQADDYHETAELLEPRKMLYELLALYGVWPDVDPNEFARKAAEQAGWHPDD
jgi:hypothetical protein